MRCPQEQQIALECLKLAGGDTRRADHLFSFVVHGSAEGAPPCWTPNDQIKADVEEALQDYDRTRREQALKSYSEPL